MDAYELLISIGYKAYEINWQLAKSNTLFESNWPTSFEKVLTLVEPIIDDDSNSSKKTMWRNRQVYNTNIWFCLVNPSQSSSCHHACP